MGTLLPGPSSMGRADLCMASELLPHSDTHSARAQRGVAIHAFLAACISTRNILQPTTLEERRVAALAAVPKDMRAGCEAIDLERLPPLNPRAAQAELGLAYDFRTGGARVLGAMLEREQVRELAQPDEVAGTTDWAAVTPHAFVSIDWKTGYLDVPPAEVNWQFRTYGLMGARAYQRERAIVGGVRILEDGRVWYDVVEMDAVDLEIHEAAVSALFTRRQEARAAYLSSGELPKQVQGPHCRFCPAFSFCPAKSALLRSVLPGAGGVAELSRSAPAKLDARQVGELYMQVSQAKELVARMEQNLKDWVRANGPAPLEHGYTLRKEDSLSTSLRGEPAEQLLFERLGAGFVEGLVKWEVKITKAALRERIAANLDEVWTHLLSAQAVTEKDRCSVAAAERALVDELGIAGAIEYTPTSKVEAYRDRPRRAQQVILQKGQTEAGET